MNKKKQSLKKPSPVSKYILYIMYTSVKDKDNKHNEMIQAS